MIQLHRDTRILLATHPVDFRKGMDGFAAVCREVLRQDEPSGRYFVFINPSRTMIRVLAYDGGENQKYGYTARALMALNKYFMGAPFFRQQSLQTILGMPISASTVFDQCELVANDAQPVFNELVKIAANAVHFRIDDTSHRILDRTEKTIPNRRTQQPHKRTGTYASGMIATLDNGRDIVLFQTNIGHAGEFIDHVLAKRDPALPPPILMSDALSSTGSTSKTPTPFRGLPLPGKRVELAIVVQYCKDMTRDAVFFHTFLFRKFRPTVQSKPWPC